MTTSQTLEVRAEGGVLHVTLNRPEVRNAMSLAMVRELREVLATAESDGTTRIVVLRGAGKHFCAGADLKDLAAARMKPAEPGCDAVADVNAAFGELCVAYASTGLAVVAVLEGTVMGGGFGLACVADIALASDAVQFRLPEVSLGVVPAQIAPFLVERLGYAQSKRLAISAARLDAREAFTLGLVHEVHAGDALDAALKRTLATILACAPGAIAATKALLAKARFAPPSALVQEAAAVFSRAAQGPEGIEGTSAFLAETQAVVGAGVSFHKVLIANRGEIACRVMRTARAMGYATVAVYSDADADAPHVQQADEAVRIGEPPAASSYLNVDAILDAARRTGADALHPGYGLSENAAFAQRVIDAGLTWIGPPPSAIAAMGSKSAAKRRMAEAGVPCLPGYLGDEQGDARLADEAARVGYPLLVKAVAGGGGRGMRLVRNAGELQAAIDGARREAKSAFGDDTLMLEALAAGARHVEVQVFADAHGLCIHLGERDCTAQRRRQKVIEEAPSPIVDAALRAALGRDAVAAARAVGYVGAGTVEFVVDADARHYFLEMNTRLQVEHPVTEAITGIDLVEWQLRIAAGEPLPLAQDEVRFGGHAIEVRLYTEDPAAGFAPQTGRVVHWRPQTALQPGVRIDDGIAEGSVVSPHYDAMVAKIVAHGRDRGDAIRKLRAAIAAAPLFGVRHNGAFLRALLDTPEFRGAAMTTSLLDEWQASGHALLRSPAPDDEAWCVAAMAIVLACGPGWRSDSVAAHELALDCGGVRETLRVRAQGREVQVTLRGTAHELTLLDGADDRTLRWRRDGVQRRAFALLHDEALHLAIGGETFVYTEPSSRPSSDAAADGRRAVAPVAGVVAKVAVAPGQAVDAGAPLVCVEAMKMEMWVAARAAGRVATVAVQAGDSVASGALLVVLEAE